MSSKHPPLEYRDVIRGLKNLGFEKRSSKKTSGTSHEQWIKDVEGKRFKVTVDKPKAPFGQDLIKSMASQAGVSKKAFYAACLN
jgi:predicted RNA binding protein YcfA (HicA-like mRNA interferase family)